MIEEIDKILLNLDKKIINQNAIDIQKEFENIPLDIFGRIQVDRPSEYPNLIQWLPKMPSSDDQIIWTGSSDHTLMNQSLAFLKTIVSTYHMLAPMPLSQSTTLDFGCGWGRFIRLLYKYVPADNIYAVDPWDKSIEICKKTNIRANLYKSDYIPRDLPTPKNKKFDFIMAFSVFTHLSEKVTKICASTLRDYLTNDGILAITIRPIEYWNFRLNHNRRFMTEENINTCIYEHNHNGFSFYPHDRQKIEGEVTYGDTSMSLDYVRNNFLGLEIVGTEFNESDRQQLIVFLKKSKI